MPRKLKVFQAQFGFYDSVVSAPSQAAALRAWGAHQNLFQDGGARLATDRQGIAAALEHPEVPLRRAVGSNDPFALDPRPPAVPAGGPGPQRARPAPSSPAAATKASRTEPPKSTHKPAPRRLPPDRTRLDAAEAALKTLDQDRRREEQAFAARRAALDKDMLAAQRAFDDARAKAKEALKVEQQAFTRAGDLNAAP